MCNWDLSKMYKDNNEIEKDIKLVNENINKIDELKKNEKDNFIKILDLLFETDRVMDNLYTYASMKKDENSKVSDLSLIHISEPTRRTERSRMPSSA